MWNHHAVVMSVLKVEVNSVKPTQSIILVIPHHTRQSQFCYNYGLAIRILNASCMSTMTIIFTISIMPKLTNINDNITL